MKPTDILALILFGSFGAWLVIAPNSVIRFYGSFHRKNLEVKPIVVRILGFLWIILFVSVILFATSK